jgi:hypothetical protein
MNRCLLAVGLLAVAAPAARADAIDRALVRNSTDIMAKVRGLKASTVAVLKFEVKFGDKVASFDAGPANTKLAQKLENLLILANDPRHKLFVVADAGEAAATAAAKAGSPFTWRTDAGRAMFCELPALPLAWDKSQALRPDAFVTGTLELNADLTEAKVTLHGFTRSNPADLVTLLTVSGASGMEPAKPLHTDRSVLALAGVAFAVGAMPASSRKADDAAARQARDLFAAGQAGNTERVFAAIAQQSPVRLEVLLNGQAVPVRADDVPGGGRVVWPAGGVGPNDAVEFRLTNAGTTDRFAVLLAVNGRNTNARNPEDDLNVRDGRDQRKWVLDPGESIRIRGFYTDLSGNHHPFSVLSAGESERLFGLMSPRFRGRISMLVYGERPEKSPTDTGPRVEVPQPGKAPEKIEPKPTEVVKPEEQKEEVEAALLSLGLGDGGLERVRAAGSLEKAQEELRRKTYTSGTNGQLAIDPNVLDKYRHRGLIVPSEQRRSDGPIKTVDFRLAPLPVASLDIKYYVPQK